MTFEKIHVYVGFYFRFRELSCATNCPLPAVEATSLHKQGSLSSLLAQDVPQSIPGTAKHKDRPNGHVAYIHEVYSHSCWATGTSESTESSKQQLNWTTHV